MLWNEIKRNEQTKEITIPDDWLHIHYYEALNILFRFENSLRVFVYIILKENLKEKWEEAHINKELTIKQISKQRQNQANDYGYLTYDINSSMLYLSSGELIDIIMNEKNWKYFAKYFKAKKEIIKHKLLEIGAIRNALAHFRPINEEDLDVIKQNVKHTLLGVEKVLDSITNLTVNVPSNSKEIWYTEFLEINSDCCNLAFFQDKNADWINIKIAFNLIKIHTIYEFDNLRRYKVVNLSSVKILKKYNELRNNLIYVNEDIRKTYQDNELFKELNFIFSSSILNNNTELIVKDITKLLKNIEDDITLIKKDNLIKSDLIDVEEFILRKENEKQDFWKCDLDSFCKKTNEFEGSEFWGKKIYSWNNSFITSNSQYPWMPVNICDNEIPF